MTDKELKELVASLAIAQKKTDDQLNDLRTSVQELRASQVETDRGIKELRASQVETDRGINDLRTSIQELRASQAKTDRQIMKMSKKIDDLGEKFGGLGEKFGGFTEGMAFPSMEKILRQRFKMDVVSLNVKTRRNGASMELDVLAYSNSGLNEVYVVEVKSRLRERGIEQMQHILEHFFEFFPSYKGKKLYGILAVVDAPEDLVRQVQKQGIYLARIHDDLFELQVPENFVPQAYQ